MKSISSLFKFNKILKLLRLKPNEAGQVGLTVIYAIFIGAVQSLIIAVPLALFLAHYNISFLPYVYISTAVVTLLAGGFFSYFEKRVTLVQLLMGAVISLIISLVLLWLFLFTSDRNWIILALIVWGWVVFNFGNLILGCLINQLFSLQQGKRIYGLIGAGQGLGGIMAGLALPFFAHVMGTKNVILVIAACLGAALFVQYVIKQRYANRLAAGGHHEATEEESGARQITLKKIIKKPYIPMIFLLIGLGIFEYYTLDMLFNTEAQQRYVSEVKLASFFGIFFASTDILNLIVGTFVLGWILERLGVIAALLFLPFTVGSLVILACIAHLIPAAVALVFWGICLARLMDETFFASVNQQSFLLLFQPLKPAERVWAETKNEATIAPIATGIIGAILLLVDKTIGVHLEHFVFILAAIYAVMVVLLFSLRSQYLKELLTALTKHVLVNPDFKRVDKDSLDILRKYLQSHFPEEVIYAIDTIEQANHDEFVKELPTVLEHPAIEVKLYALAKIEQHKIYSVLSQVQAICVLETDPRVLEKALVAWAAVGGADAWDLLAKYLVSDNLILRSGAVIGLIKYGSTAVREKAFDCLTSMATSALNEERLLVAQAAQQIKMSGYTQLLLPLLQDADIEVRGAACKAVERLSEKSLYPVLIENLLIPGIGDVAFRSLQTQGGDIVEFIKERFDHYSIGIQCLLIKLLGNISHGHATELLLHYLAYPNKRVMHQTLQALRQQQQVPANKIELFKECISKELVYLTELQNILLSIALNDQTQILHGLIYREIELGKERLFLSLSFFYPAEAMLTARDGFATRDEDMVSYATEVLTRTLDDSDLEHVFPVLTFNTINDFIEENADVTQQLLNGLRRLLKQDHNYYVLEIKSAIIYTIALLMDRGFLDQIKTLAATDKNDKVLQETYAWALARLERIN